jgi:hypothetical protein
MSRAAVVLSTRPDFFLSPALPNPPPEDEWDSVLVVPKHSWLHLQGLPKRVCPVAPRSLPEVRSVDEATITANQQRIFRDARDIYDDVMEMLRNDSTRLHLMVNKSGG